MPSSESLAPLFGLLSSLYLCRPTADAITNWRTVLEDRDPPAFDELKAALHEIDLSSAQAQEELLWEYTRLFVGPYRLPCPPWESVYTSSTRLLMQEAHDQVRALYAEAGVELGDPRILPDHVGAELNFLAILIERAERGEAEALRSHQLAEQFYRQHLQNWIPRFTRDLETAAESALYQALARATGNVLQWFGTENGYSEAGSQ